MIFELRVFLALILGLNARGLAMEKIREKANPSLPLQILMKIGFEIDDDKTRINFFSASKKLREKGKNYYTERGEKVWNDLFPDIAPSKNWTVLCMLYKNQDFIKLLRKNTEIEFNGYTKSRRVKKRKGDSTTSVFWDGILKKLPDTLEFNCKMLPLDALRVLENKTLKLFLLNELPFEYCIRTWFTLDSIGEYVSRKALDEETVIKLIPLFKFPFTWKKKSTHDRYKIITHKLVDYHKILLKNNKDSFFAIFYNKKHRERKKLFKLKPLYFLDTYLCLCYKKNTE